SQTYRWISSSAPGGTRRNSMCHTAARTSPMTTTRRENLGVVKNPRVAKRYAIPASVKEAMKYGPPLSPKLRELTVSATHNVAPSMYTLHAGVIFTILLCPSATGLSHVPTPSATPPFVGPWPEPDVIPLRAESGRRLHRCRKKDLRRQPTAQEPGRVIRVFPARCWCPIRRLRKA